MAHPIVHSQLDRLQALLDIAKHVQKQLESNPHPEPEMGMYEPEIPPVAPHEPYK